MIMERFAKIKAGKRRGFSLIAVLIIAVAGMALVGGILYTFQAFSGSARQVISSSWVYNDLQEGVEQGKAFLREKILALDPGTDKVLTWKPDSGTHIDELEDLLICDTSGTPIGHIVHKNINEKGVNGTMDVYIYAMGYTSSDIAPGIDAAERAKLPPIIEVNSVPTGDCDCGGNGDGMCPCYESCSCSSSPTGGPSAEAGAYLIRAVFKDDDTGVEKSIETALVQSMKEK
jgi:hypothetical protein